MADSRIGLWLILIRGLPANFYSTDSIPSRKYSSQEVTANNYYYSINIPKNICYHFICGEIGQLKIKLSL